MRKQHPVFLLAILTLVITLTGCSGSSNFKDDPEVTVAKQRMAAAEDAYKASKMEYNALIQKKKADQSKMEADQKLAEAHQQAQAAQTEASKAYEAEVEK